MRENKQRLLNDLHQSVMQYRNMKEETSDQSLRGFSAISSSISKLG
jgi:hypothetical protein